MAKSGGQKARVLLLWELLRERTDENNFIKTSDILIFMENQGIKCDRKTLYSDIDALRSLDLEIETESTRNGGGWKLISRDFELAEMKLLVDAVQSSRFITAKKSSELITKLEKLVSKSQAQQLNRQVFVADRNKTANEEIFYVVDNIHRAMQEGVQVTFSYLDWNLKKELVERNPGERRRVSPWSLIWKDENYYLLAKDSKDGKFKHFRVDKMARVEIEKEGREGSIEFARIDLSSYADSTFGMFGGETQTVTMEFPAYMIGVIIDRFGKEVNVRKEGNDLIHVRKNLVVSPQFYGWLAGLGKNAVIVSPASVKEEYFAWLQEILNHGTDC